MDAKAKTELEAVVLKFFGGDAAKTALWFEVSNPLLGGITPNRMIEAGRYDKLLKWAKEQISENRRPSVEVCKKNAAFVVVGKSKGRGKTKRPEMVMSCPLHLGAITEQVVHLCYKASVEYGPSAVRCEHGIG